ncbi:MAG: hypothetical protein OHK0039_26430 [Bacteroidia bacterium]
MSDLSYKALQEYYAKAKLKDPRSVRLSKEHLRLAELCEKSTRISYTLPDKKPLPPDTYIITYKLRSIVAIDADKQPVYADEHRVQVTFPANFPIGGASCYMLTPAWHPNIKWDGPYKGRICGNTAEFGSLFFLNMLVLRIGEILQYKNYHAVQEPPFPEDENVARWMREFAEPHDIVNKNKGIYTDPTSLLVQDDPSGEAEPPSAQPPVVPPVVLPVEKPPVAEPPVEDRAASDKPARIRIMGKPRDEDPKPEDNAGGGMKIRINPRK